MDRKEDANARAGGETDRAQAAEIDAALRLGEISRRLSHCSRPRAIVNRRTGLVHVSVWVDQWLANKVKQEQRDGWL